MSYRSRIGSDDIGSTGQDVSVCQNVASYRKRGTEAPAFRCGERHQSGYDSAMRLLSGDDPPDAIFCASDNMALGAMDAARYGLGMQVPHDVSIMGYDDIPIARWSSYDLTTVAQQVDHMVDLTIKLMLDKLEEPDSPPVLKLVPGVMRIRFTVRGANHDFV